MRQNVRLGLVLVSGLILAGCTGPGSEPTPSGLPSGPDGPTPPVSAEPGEGTVTADIVHGNVPLKLVVHPVERLSETALLTIDWTVGADSPRTEPVHITQLMGDPIRNNYMGSLRLVDLDDSWVSWPVLESGQVASSYLVSARPGETVTSEAVFAIPPGETVDVLLPHFGVIEGVPVVDAGPGTSDPEELGVSPGEVLPSAPLESFIVAFDDSSTASVEGEETTVALASDVLFATDEYELTPEAESRVDEVAGRIQEVAREGEVAVVGHTDDVASEAYNLELSVKRAESVAVRLGPALGSDFTVTTEGRGESEPVAEGTSSEARAANRRVEIRFAAVTSGSPVDVSSAPVPDTDGVVGSGHETVEVEQDDQRYEVAVRRVEARSGYLIGTVEVVRRSETGAVRTLFLASGWESLFSRGYGNVTTVAGAASVRLAGQGSWVYPVDYQVETTEHGYVRRSVLADRVIRDPFGEADMPATVTVVWPDTGQDVVTVDVAGRFRITDVPVEGRS